MPQHLAHITLLVNNYDEAIVYYTQVLKFTLVQDVALSETKRWVLVAPSGGGCQLLLAQPSTAEQQAAIGNQTGGRVFLFLHTNSFEEDYDNLMANQVKIISPPVEQPHGKTLVFEDRYGNKWDLIAPVQ
jgi:uncharacterized glyoxalase superfamily protein PhnB